MNQSFRLSINLLLCSLSFSGCVQMNAPVISLPAPTEKDFFQNLTTTPLSLSSQMQLGVVPHHEVAKAWISEFWATIATSKPQTIIIISPNHFDVDKEKIITAQNTWNTSVGRVETNNDVIDSLKKLPFLIIDSTAVSQDHGITTHIPYIAHFMPGTKIIALLVSNYIGMEEINTLATTLAKDLDSKNDVVVASIDFSHYLSKGESEKKDEITKQLIETNDANHIINLNNDYLDARSGMILVQQLAYQLGCKQPTFFHHGNSADFINASSGSTTSYFIFGYTKDNCMLGKQ